MFTEKFKVVAVSSNTNSFGLHSVIMTTKSGVAYEVYANYLNKPKKDEVVIVPCNVRGDEVVGYNFAAKSFEVPTLLAAPPQELLDQLFPA